MHTTLESGIFVKKPRDLESCAEILLGSDCSANSIDNCITMLILTMHVDIKCRIISRDLVNQVVTAARAWFLEIALVRASVCVCTAPEACHAKSGPLI